MPNYQLHQITSITNYMQIADLVSQS